MHINHNIIKVDVPIMSQPGSSRLIKLICKYPTIRPGIVATLLLSDKLFSFLIEFSCQFLRISIFDASLNS